MFCGCKFNLDTSDITKFGDQLNEVADEFNRSLTKIENAADKVDPVAVKKLLKSNDELRKKLIEMTRKIDGYTEGTGKIVLKDRKLQIQILEYRGEFRINSWVDEPKNWHWNNVRFGDKNTKLSIDFKQIWSNLYEGLRRKGGHGTLSDDQAWERMRYDGGLDEVFRRYQATLEQRFDEYLKSTTIPNHDKFADLHSQLEKAGPHIIGIEVTPIANDNYGKWAIKGAIVSITPGRDVEKIKEFDLDSDLIPGHEMGKPLEVIKALITVVTSSDS